MNVLERLVVCLVIKRGVCYKMVSLSHECFGKVGRLSGN